MLSSGYIAGTYEGPAAVMMKYLAGSADHIYFPLRATDFKKQTNGLCAIIFLQLTWLLTGLLVAQELVSL